MRRTEKALEMWLNHLEPRIFGLVSAHDDPHTPGPTFLWLSRKLMATYEDLEETIDGSGTMFCNVAIRAGGHGGGIAELPRGEWTVELNDPDSENKAKPNRRHANRRGRERREK